MDLIGTRVMKEILFTEWVPGLAKINLTKLLQEKTGLSLSEAKSVVDRVLAGAQVIVSVASEEEAIVLQREAEALGAVCVIR